MARVHMFKSAADKQKQQQQDAFPPLEHEQDLPASPSLIVHGSTTTTTPAEEEMTTTATANNSNTEISEAQLNRNESAALTAALLQKATTSDNDASNMDVVNAMAAALSAKQGK